MEQNSINLETGILSNLDSQVNNSNLENQIDLESMTDEELINLLIDCNYSTSEVSRRIGKFLGYAARIYKKRGIDYNKLREENKRLRLNQYNLNPNKCQHCGKELDWEHRNNKYCSSSCAASENNKGVIRNPNGINGEKTTISNIERNDNKTARIHNKLLLKYSELKIPEINPGCCPICGEYHCENEFCKKHNFQQLISLVNHLNFDPEAIGTKNVFSEFERVRELVYDLYWNQRKSGIELEQLFNYGKFTIYDVLSYLEIPRRTAGDAVKNSILTGRSNIASSNNSMFNNNQCWHTTWFGEKVFLRSSYEIDYAKELDSNKIFYQVESIRLEYFDTLLNKTRIAVPDFYLPNTNEIVEIKSDFTLDIQEMLDKFGAYKNLGYIPKLILEHKEVSLYNIENEISKDRIDKIKTGNIKQILLTKNAKTP
jgi:hypothetical protein